MENKSYFKVNYMMNKIKAENGAHVLNSCSLVSLTNRPFLWNFMCMLQHRRSPKCFTFQFPTISSNMMGDCRTFGIEAPLSLK